MSATNEASSAQAPDEGVPAPDPTAERRSPLFWIGTLVFVAAVLIAAWLRFVDLSLKPLHSDEGVNGWFLMNLYEGLAKWRMNYRYDPTNYHGPFLYFAGLVPFLTAGPSNAALRFLPALAGVGCVAILWPIRRWLGWAGLATAAFLIAISPPFVYFSRTAIHEIYVFFFSLAAVVCLVRAYAGTGDPDETVPPFRRNWFLWGVLSLALVFTNKETAVITFASFGGSLAVAWLFSRVGGRGSATAADRIVTGAGVVAMLGVAAVVHHFVAKGRPVDRLLPIEQNTIYGAIGLALAGSVAWVLSTWNRPFRLGERLRRARTLAEDALGGLAALLAGPAFALRAAIPALHAPARPDPEGGKREPTTSLARFHARLDARLDRFFLRFKAPFVDLSDYALAYAWGIAVVVILFTSFFNHPRGVIDMFATYGTWVGRGHAGAGHDKPFAYWIQLLWEFDAPILVLALAGTVGALWRRDRFGLFVAAWSWSLWLVYSVISYKTPWLNLNFTGAMALLGGVAVRELARVARAPAFDVALAAVVPVALVLWPVPAGPVLSAEKGAHAGADANPENVSWWTLMDDVNFRHFDDDRYPIIYVQTVRDFETLVGRVERLFEVHGPIDVWTTSGDYWPLPFYFRDHDKIGYHQGKIPAGTPPGVVIASSSQEAELRSRLAGYRVERFMLRPGVVLTLYVEPALWDPVFGPPPELLPPEPAPAEAGRMAPGLVAEYRYGIGCGGEVLARRVDEHPVYGGMRREFRAPICVVWKGFLKIDEAGEYGFTTRSDDGSWVWLDGELAVDNGGAHGPIPRSGVLRALEPGLHPIEVRYFDAGGGASLDVKLRRRGGLETSLQGLVFHDVQRAQAVTDAGERAAASASGAGP